jgi:hypothetical protein
MASLYQFAVFDNYCIENLFGTNHKTIYLLTLLVVAVIFVPKYADHPH